MFENMKKYLHPKTGRGGQGFGWKNWVAYILFGAIIIVFALFGLDQNQGQSSTGGVAAVVNHESISIAQFRQHLESKEQNMRMGMDQFPEAQRRLFAQRMRKEAMDELILHEVVFQAASDRGVIVADGEIREYIRQIPVLQDNGVFKGDRYRQFLEQMGLTAADFERQVRKQLVTQKLQELFVGSATPSREELRRNRLLANQKVSIRFAELKEAELGKMLTESDVKTFQESKKAEIEKYYNDNKVEFTQTETLAKASPLIARRLLVRGHSGEAAGSLRKFTEGGDKRALETELARAGVKWQDSGEFDLSSSTIPKLGESQALLAAVLKQGPKGGLVPQVIPHREGFVVAEIISWKEVPDKNTEVEGLERMVAFRKSSDLIQTWSKDVEAKASVQRNTRLFQ